MTEHEFPSGLFADPARAARLLNSLYEAFITSGSLHALAEFTRAVESHLDASPDPDMALTNLVRFSEVAVSKASLFNDLVQYPVVLDLLMRLFGYSQYFADILVRDPGLFRWLTTSDAMNRPLTEKYLHAEAERLMRTFQRPERRLDALKRLHRRELLRIGARDIVGSDDVAATTLQLSLLADTAIDAAYRIAIQQLSEKYPVAPDTPFVVIGLGKLGGEELNYSSDIDVLFVYRDDDMPGADAVGPAYSRHEYFNKLAEKIVGNLSQPTAEGYLYRVDVRLRPESGAGPLTRSMESHLLYYESRGELWERQMLIKARPVAGDKGFGRDFLLQLEPFIYPRTQFRHPGESVAKIKGRIEATVGDAANIKLMPGGIRDIEFVVQTLQLVDGGKLETIRQGNTLSALGSLAERNILSADEASILEEAYRHYRTLEHRLQMVFNTQTHTIPADDRSFEALARRMGLPGGNDLRTVNERYLHGVRRIFDQVLSVQPVREESGILGVVEGSLNEETGRTVLQHHGFEDAPRAYRNIRTLTTGGSLSGAGEFESRTKEMFRSIAPDLFQGIRDTPDPDMTLNNLTSLICAQKFPGQMYNLLSVREFRSFVLAICGISPRFSRGLANDQLLLESLATEGAPLEDDKSPAIGPGSDLLEFKTRLELRAGIRHLLGYSTFEGLTDELSRLADGIVSAVFALEVKKARAKNVPLAVFALGKYGTRECTFDADLDLLFIAGEGMEERRSAIENLAAAVVQRLTTVTTIGRLYEVDARLRPEGKSSPLVADAAGYAQYLRQRASLWERQALTRIRFVCGDTSLADRVLADVWSFVYDSPLPADWVESIVGMRRRMEKKSRFREAETIDIKVGPGGMADIEFLTQMIQLKTGGGDQLIRGKPVLEVLSRLTGRCVAADESAHLCAAYRLYREIEKLMRITLEERGSVLPEGRNLTLLARCLDRSTPAELRNRLSKEMHGIRKAFLEISQRIAMEAAPR